MIKNMPAVLPSTCRAVALQEYEKRYKIWRAHLDFATAHNTAHKSHWVSGADLIKIALPTICIPRCACTDSALRTAASHHIELVGIMARCSCMIIREHR